MNDTWFFGMSSLGNKKHLRSNNQTALLLWFSHSAVRPSLYSNIGCNISRLAVFDLIVVVGVQTTEQGLQTLTGGEGHDLEHSQGPQHEQIQY